MKKIFLQKSMFQIDMKKFLLLQKSKILFREHMLLVILKAKKLLERFTKKNCKKRITVIKRKGNRLYVKWKGCHISFNGWIDKKYVL